MSLEFIGFKFKHPSTKEVKLITLSVSEIQDLLEDHLIEKLVEIEEPVGYGDSSGMDYDDYLYEFELVGREA